MSPEERFELERQERAAEEARRRKEQYDRFLEQDRIEEERKRASRKTDNPGCPLLLLVLLTASSSGLYGLISLISLLA